MPNKSVVEVLKRLGILEETMQNHLVESGEIKGDIKWLKWFVMGTTGGWGAILVAVAIWSIKKG
jgi:hypothetical protein